MRSTSSIRDFVDARASVPSLLSELAFGSSPPAEAAERLRAAYSIPKPFCPNRTPAQ